MAKLTYNPFTQDPKIGDYTTFGTANGEPWQITNEDDLWSLQRTFTVRANAAQNRATNGVFKSMRDHLIHKGLDEVSIKLKLKELNIKDE